MVELEVNAGICGFKTKVKAESNEKYRCTLQVESECSFVQKMAEKLSEVNAMNELFKKGQSQILAATEGIIPHITCPVAGGILRAVEVCSGLALPKNVSIQFKNS